MSYDSVFELPQNFDSIWKGIGKFDLQQILPDAGMPANTVIGTGNASGITSFTWSGNSNEWWSPVNSYFYFKLKFVKYTGSNTYGPIPILDSTTGNLIPGDLVCYADNFVSTLFSTIQTYINTEVVDAVTQPWVVDQVLTYSGAKKNFLDTFGSLARVGEPLNARLLNTANEYLEVCYRPPCSIYNVNLLPPGAQHQIAFTWNQNVVNAFESLIGSIDTNIGTTTGNYNIIIDNFYFYKATCVPAMGAQISSQGVIELNPCKVKQYPINNTNSYQQNITLAPTTNRIYVAFQDINQSPKVTSQTTASTSPYIDTTGIKFMGYGTGWTPITSFTKSFSWSANPATTAPVLNELSNFYIQVNDLSLILPHPIYKFDTNGGDYLRGYMDWGGQTVGTKYNDNGSVSFGKAIPGYGTTPTFASLKIPGTTIIAPAITVASSTTATYQSGNPSNEQQLNLITDKIFDYPATTNTHSLYFQTYEHGWMGRHPGPIFCFNVCRPTGSKVSQGDITVTFTGTVANALANVLCCYNNAIAVQRNSSGKYDYMLTSGE